MAKRPTKRGSLKAIETHYAGCRFRSRTEARWAYFMDLMGVRWEYEYEGWELPSGRYLPDFRLPTAKVYLEIKGEPPTEREVDLALELASEACVDGWRYRMLAGDIPRNPINPPGMPDIVALPCMIATTAYQLLPTSTATDVTLQDPFGIQKATTGFSVAPTDYAGIPTEAWQLKPSFWNTQGWTIDNVTAALTAARSARFEHGETPQRPQP